MIEMTQTKENERVLELKTGNKIYLRREDPYGLWSISFERGRVPSALTGMYTTAEQGRAAIHKYVHENDMEEGEKVVPPKLETKKVSAKAAAKAEELKKSDSASHAA